MDQRGKGLGQGHIANRGQSWEEGLGPLTSTAGLKLPWRAAWEVRCGWCGGGKEAHCQGAVREELGAEWEEPSWQASSMGRDADDVDTMWALLQSRSTVFFPSTPEIPGGSPGGGELPVTGGM